MLKCRFSSAAASLSTAAAAALVAPLRHRNFSVSKPKRISAAEFEVMRPYLGLTAKWQSDKRLMYEQEEQLRQLRLDAAMRAGQLFSPAGSGHAVPAAMASGLLALTRLDNADLAHKGLYTGPGCLAAGEHGPSISTSGLRNRRMTDLGTKVSRASRA
jgi:hypothetical protein